MLFLYKKSKSEYRARIHPSRLDKFKAKLKELTSGSNGMEYEKVKQKLKQYING